MDKTKDFIIDEAYKLFMKHGYEAVSISAISKAIGYSKGAIYHHFKNKEELFMSVVDNYLKMPNIIVDIETISLFEYNQLFIKQIAKNLMTVCTFSLTFSPISYISMLADAFRHYPGYAKSKGTSIDKEIERLSIILGNAIKRNEIRSDINTKLIATKFFLINTGFACNLLKKTSINEINEIVKEQSTELYKLLKIR